MILWTGVALGVIYLLYVAATPLHHRNVARDPIAWVLFALALGLMMYGASR